MTGLVSFLRRSANVLLPILCMTVALTACGPSNTVRLLYSPPASGSQPSATAPHIAVVTFEDRRTQDGSIGIRTDSSPFMPNAQVTDWAARSLSDELTKLGMRVSYAANMAQARAAKPNAIVSGVVSEVWLKENSLTSMTATVRLTVTLTGANGSSYSENLSASQERKGLPSTSTAESLLRDTLREMLASVAQKLVAKLS